MINWHRLFGMTLTDFFTDTAFRVEVEKDLSGSIIVSANGCRGAATAYSLGFQPQVGSDPTDAL